MSLIARSTLLSLTAIACTGAAATSYIGPEPAAAIYSDVRAAATPTDGAVFQRKTLDALRPNLPVYDAAGQRVGTIRALAKRGDAPIRVYMDRTAYAAADFTIIDNRVIMSAPVQTASLSTETAAR